jgi:hypothetical protein
MSSRFGVALLLALAVTGALPTAFARSPAPVLGWKDAFQDGQGFGSVKPRTVYLGGDPTGDVTAIRWRQWGLGHAVGFGRGWCPGRSVASGHPCSVALHAYGLGTCHGRLAYRTLAFYFKSGTKWTVGSKWDVCSGP